MKYINYSVVGQERFRKTKTYVFKSDILEFSRTNNILNDHQNLSTSTTANFIRNFDAFEASIIDLENVFRTIPLKTRKITRG
jgi:hypothetical protein